MAANGLGRLLWEDRNGKDAKEAAHEAGGRVLRAARKDPHSFQKVLPAGLAMAIRCTSCKVSFGLATSSRL